MKFVCWRSSDLISSLNRFNVLFLSTGRLFGGLFFGLLHDDLLCFRELKSTLMSLAYLFGDILTENEVEISVLVEIVPLQDLLLCIRLLRRLCRAIRASDNIAFSASIVVIGSRLVFCLFSMCIFFC